MRVEFWSREAGGDNAEPGRYVACDLRGDDIEDLEIDGNPEDVSALSAADQKQVFTEAARDAEWQIEMDKWERERGHLAVVEMVD